METLSASTSLVCVSALALTSSVITRPAAAQGIKIGNCDGGKCGQFCQRDEVGTVKVYRVTGIKWGDTAQVWGTGPEYLADSLVDEAVVHAGLLNHGKNGTIQITCVAEPERYSANIRNGVTSQAVNENGQYKFPLVDAPKGAYAIEKWVPPQGPVTPAPPATPVPTTAVPTTQAPTPTAVPTPPKQRDTPRPETSSAGDENANNNNDGKNSDEDSGETSLFFTLYLPIALTLLLLGCVCMVAMFLREERQEQKTKKTSSEREMEMTRSLKMDQTDSYERYSSSASSSSYSRSVTSSASSGNWSY